MTKLDIADTVISAVYIVAHVVFVVLILTGLL